MARGLRWSEADLLRYQSRGGEVVDRPPSRLYEPVAAEMCLGPGQHAIYLDNLPTRTEKNTNEHWWTRAQRAQHQRSTTYRWLQHCLGLTCPLTLPCTVTVTRLAPGTLDSFDNLQSALSHVVDGISDYLAGEYLKGQDRHPDLTWHYGQRKGGAGQYGVEIHLAGTPRPT
jgi:hypothetical protein